MNGRSLTGDEKEALAKDVGRAIDAALRPFIARGYAEDVCLCCVARAIVGALVSPLTRSAALATGGHPEQVDQFLDRVASHLAANLSALKVATATDDLPSA